MPRLFVAVDVPSALRDVLAQLRCELPGAKWVPASQLHLTLRFLGDVPDESVPPLVEALRAIDLAPFTSALAGVGQFPPNRAAHVLWAGLAPSAALAELEAAVEQGVVALGHGASDHPFSPHITLARLRDAPRVEVKRFLERHASLASDPFAVREFVLYASVLSPKGATHTPIGTFELPERA